MQPVVEGTARHHFVHRPIMANDPIFDLRILLPHRAIDCSAEVPIAVASIIVCFHVTNHRVFMETQEGSWISTPP